MTQLIKDDEIVETEFELAQIGETQNLAGKIVPLDTFLSLADKSQSGVWLDAHEDVGAISDFINKIPVIALNFPIFSDGRSYSSANILRRFYKYQGEIRAIGDVRIDQLEQMKRCGFNAFALPENQNVEKAIAVLQGFSFSYQATTDREPVFLKRA